MEKYRKRVDRLATLEDCTPIYNGSLEHARILIEKLFDRANERVVLLSGSLEPKVYSSDEVLEQANFFLSKGHRKARVLIEHDNPDDRPGNGFFELLDVHKNLEIRVVPKELAETYDFHFLVADGKSYRFEHDKRQPAAIAVFGDCGGASDMESVFEELWSNSVELTPSKHTEEAA